MNINLAHIHLLLNHFPILGLLFGVLVLLFVLWKKSDEIKKLSLLVFVGIGLLSIPAYLTGEPAEKLIEHLPGVSESLIEKHEESAELAFIFAEVLGGLSLLNYLLFCKRPLMARKILFLILLGGVASFGLMARTGALGGEIRHEEIRPDYK